MNQEKIGKLIAKLRKEKNMTQADLGKALGVTKNAVSKWERGLCLMDMSLLEPLCKILDISIVELLNGEEIKKDDYKVKSEEVVTNTIKYSKKEIKKTKYKNIAGTIITIIIITLLIFVAYKTFLIYTFNFGEPDDAKEISEGLKKSDEIKIYKKTIPEDLYLTIDNIKIRNDFQKYEREERPLGSPFTQFTYKENDKVKSRIIISSSLPQYIDMFSSDDLTFYLGEDEYDKNPHYKEKFDYADRKYFLLRNDINDDIDFMKYIGDNYYIKSNIFMSRRKILENYSFNLFISITIPKITSITNISGDYSGYIFNTESGREVHIIRDDQNYIFTLVGEEITSNEYLEDLFSTLEIR